MQVARKDFHEPVAGLHGVHVVRQALGETVR